MMLLNDASNETRTKNHDRSWIQIVLCKGHCRKRNILILLFFTQISVLCYLYQAELGQITTEYVVQQLENKLYSVSHVPQNNTVNTSISVIPVPFDRNGSEEGVTVLLSADISSKMYAISTVSESTELAVKPSISSNTVKDKTMRMHNITLPRKRTIPILRASKENLLPLIDLITTISPKEMGEAFMGPIEKEVLPECPKTPPGLQGQIDITFSAPPHTYKEIEEDNPLVSDGGSFKPPYCIARSKVAIVIPFRNRDRHLRYFLQYMHPTLQRQQLHYRIYIINQIGNGKFNRAKLMNIGYAESMKDEDFGCFTFHDVDLILENDKAIYNCPAKPRHLSSAVDKFNYRLPYPSIFGGVTQLSKSQFEKVNGYSNLFWGWGGEDDDMYNRIRVSSMNIMRYPIRISRYRMISHEREKGNELNPKRFEMIRKTRLMMLKDGINSLSYDVISRDVERLYTNITVDIHVP